MKTTTLADELSTQIQQPDAADAPAAVQDGATFLAARPLMTALATPAATTAPATAALGTTTFDTLAQTLAGQAFLAADTAFVTSPQINSPFTTVSGEQSWGGSVIAMRGNGIDIGFANPRDGTATYDSGPLMGTTVNVVTVDVSGYFKTTNGYRVFGAYDILGYDGTSVLLGAENTPNNGLYPSLLLVHNTTLQPGVTNVTFPLTDLGSTGAQPLLPADQVPTIPAPPCYLAGTRVATARGEVAVEMLQVGDLVRTVDGAGGFKPVVWIGQRSLNAAHHPEPEQVLPVRIRAGAFAEGVPSRDLLVSPDHAVFTDGALVPARLLINGGSIVQDASIRRISYVHVELDSHSVMLAEGLPAESYLAGTNRGAFANGPDAVALHPSFATDAAAYAGRACAELAIDSARVLPVWSRLAARGATMGLTPRLPAVTAEAEFRVVVGKRVLTGTVAGDRVVFTLPRATKSVRLVSRGARPADTRPWLDDRRRLGVMVAGLAVHTGRGRKEIAVDAAALTDGWWAIEASDVGAVRWTNGDATVAMPRGARTLEVKLVGEMSYPAEAALAA